MKKFLVLLLSILIAGCAYWMYDKGDNGNSMFTTAEEVVEGLNLKGRVFIVTGSNSGIGFETARVLSSKGATVVLAARTFQKSQEAAQAIRNFYPSAGSSFSLYPLELDLDKFSSIENFVSQFLALNLPLHVLILNAGVMGIPERTTTSFGVETQIGTNHVAQFYLTSLLLPKLKENGSGARVVAVSSFGEFPKFENSQYDPWIAYGNSKLANVLFASELHRRYSAQGITAVSLHPGVIHTNLHRHNNDAISNAIIKVLNLFWKTPSQGAATTVYAATSPEIDSENLGGKFLANAHVSSIRRPYLLTDGTPKKFWEATEALITEIQEHRKKERDA